MSLAVASRMTADDYLAWESQQAERNEFVRGEVFSMVGVTRKHATVTVNLVNVLSRHLEESPCRVYSVDMKLHVEEAGAYFYPDVFVTCDPRDHQADAFMSSAVLIIEVLSESNAAYDRGEKFGSYRKLQSLKEYVLIDPERKQLECFRRDDRGLWVLHEVDPDGNFVLESVDMRLASADVFRRVD